MCSTFQGYPRELMCGMLYHNALLCPLVSIFKSQILKFGPETHPRADLSLLHLVRRPCSYPLLVPTATLRGTNWNGKLRRALSTSSSHVLRASRGTETCNTRLVVIVPNAACTLVTPRDGTSSDLSSVYRYTRSALQPISKMRVARHGKQCATAARSRSTASSSMRLSVCIFRVGKAPTEKNPDSEWLSHYWMTRHLSPPTSGYSPVVAHYRDLTC